ncbi:hypothetical protein B0H19DRAFT_1065851 [Mycena capillaripes]|nr:hypothetical protein B0H19DRAFT_1065851 [Mycena capillaripes]
MTQNIRIDFLTTHILEFAQKSGLVPWESRKRTQTRGIDAERHSEDFDNNDAIESPWPKLRVAFECTMSGTGFEKYEDFITSYKYISANSSSKEVYNELSKELTQRTKMIAEVIRKDPSSYNNEWEKYSQGALCLNQLFKPLNNGFVESERNNGKSTDTALNVALGEWNTHVFQPLSHKLRPISEVQRVRAYFLSQGLTTNALEKMYLQLALVAPPTDVDIPDQSISEFCKQYSLSPKIQQHLENSRFNTLKALVLVSAPILQNAGFKEGEIMELQRALNDAQTTPEDKDKRTTNRVPLRIFDFCTTYDLAGIYSRLITDGFETAEGLLKASDDNLEGAGLSIGEIAELKLALRRHFPEDYV